MPKSEAFMRFLYQSFSTWSIMSKMFLRSILMLCPLRYQILSFEITTLIFFWNCNCSFLECLNCRLLHICKQHNYPTLIGKFIDTYNMTCVPSPLITVHMNTLDIFMHKENTYNTENKVSNIVMTTRLLIILVENGEGWWENTWFRCLTEMMGPGKYMHTSTTRRRH